jgi:hypothetical protein
MPLHSTFLNRAATTARSTPTPLVPHGSELLGTGGDDGRLTAVAAALAGQPRAQCAPSQGYVADFEAAKAAWKRCWESAEVPIDRPPALRRPSA